MFQNTYERTYTHLYTGEPLYYDHFLLKSNELSRRKIKAQAVIYITIYKLPEHLLPECRVFGYTMEKAAHISDLRNWFQGGSELIMHYSRKRRLTLAQITSSYNSGDEINMSQYIGHTVVFWIWACITASSAESPR